VYNSNFGKAATAAEWFAPAEMELMGMPSKAWTRVG
jgi:hypothetical protein